MKPEKLLTGNYKKAFLAVCFLGLAVILLLLIPALKEKREYVYSLNKTVLHQKDETSVVCENIELPLGIYSVQVMYQTEADLKYVVYLTDLNKNPLQVMQNAETLGAANRMQEFHLWLFFGPQNLTLYADGAAGQEITFRELRIINTGQIWYCMMFAVFSCCVFLLAGILIVAAFRRKRISVSDFLCGALVMILTLVLSRPFLMNWLNQGGDLAYHVERIAGVAESLKNGVFPMRLEPNFPYGYGYADGIMYGSLLLYIPALLQLIGLPVMYSYNIFVILINFAEISIAFYCFTKIFKDKYIGLLCSALYSFSLYKIIVLYGRGCLGEGCSRIFMPLLLYGYYRLFTEDIKDKRYRTVWLFLLAGYTGIVQSHTLSAELALIFTVLACILCVRRVFRKETILELCKGAAATLLCNAWYLVPFLDYYFHENLLIKYTGDRTIQFEGITWDLIFVHRFDGVLVREDGTNIRAAGPGLIPMLALFVFMGLLLYLLIKGRRNGLLTFAGICAGLTVVCVLFSLKTFPWDYLQQLHSVTKNMISNLQFPTRFLNWASLFIVLPFGYCLRYAKYECNWRKLAYPAGVMAALLAVGTSSCYTIYHATYDYGKARIFDNNQFVGYLAGGEYVINGTNLGLLSSYGRPEKSDGVELSAYRKGALSAAFHCENTTEEEGYAEVPLLLYKGYHAYTDGGEELLCRYGDNNVIRVLIPPAFQGGVTVRFVSPVSWRLSEVVSLAAILAVVIWGVIGKKDFV